MTACIIFEEERRTGFVLEHLTPDEYLRGLLLRSEGPVRLLLGDGWVRIDRGTDRIIVWNPRRQQS